MKLVGYTIAVVAGWFSWQFLFVLGNNIQRDDGPFALQLLFIWFGLPLGMAISGLVAWVWFSIIPSNDNRSSSSNAQTAGMLACLAALGSCGWFASSTQQNPPEVFFFPLASHFNSR